MARTDAIVLGAGIVGTSIALHLAKRGLSVALVDRRGPGEETSYGNAGVIEGNTLFPHPFPAGFRRAAADRAQAGDRRPTTTCRSCRRSRPGCWPIGPTPRSSGGIEFAEQMRPLFARAIAEHEALMAEAGADALPAQGRLAQALPQRGGVRGDRARARAGGQVRPAASRARRRGARARSSRRWRRCFARPCIGRAPRASPIRWRVTQAYAARFAALGGVMLNGDARTLHRDGTRLAGRHRRRAGRCRARRWSRSGRGRPTCSSRSASICRWRSSAAITGISVRAAMPA